MYILLNYGIDYLYLQTLILLLEKLPSLSPLTMASVAVKILDLCKRMGFQLQLELTLKSLLERYSLTFNMCILQTITLLQVHLCLNFSEFFFQTASSLHLIFNLSIQFHLKNFLHNIVVVTKHFHFKIKIYYSLDTSFNYGSFFVVLTDFCLVLIDMVTF